MAGHPASSGLKKSLPGPTYLRCMSHDCFYYKKYSIYWKSAMQKLWTTNFDEFFSYIFCHCAIAECISWMFFERLWHTANIKKVVVSTANIIIIIFLHVRCLLRTKNYCQKNWKKNYEKKYSAAWCVIYILCMSCCCNS